MADIMIIAVIAGAVFLIVCRELRRFRRGQRGGCGGCGGYGCSGCFEAPRESSDDPEK